MASEKESFLVLVHCFGKIQRSKKYCVKFTDREPLSVFISSSSTLSDIKNSILQKLGVFGSKWVKKLFYKIPIAVVSTGVKYDTFVIVADEDIWVLFHCVRSFPEVRIHELYAKLEAGVNSSGASALVHSSTVVGDASSSMPAAAPTVSQQTFEVDTGRGIIHDDQGFEEPDRVENAMRDDDFDQEHVDIIGDSDNDTGVNPHTQYGPSSSGTQQYPLHFSTLNLEALGQQADGGATIGDHRQLDYHVICARIYPLVRADAAVTVKVLQQATEADYGFRPSYKKVWMAKQKERQHIKLNMLSTQNNKPYMDGSGNPNTSKPLGLRLGNLQKSKTVVVVVAQPSSQHFGLSHDIDIYTTRPVQPSPNYIFPSPPSMPNMATSEVEPGLHSCPQTAEMTTTS
ncbi:uncharacterized protein LOC107477253 [Arachis duranensis]|uniref:Uncharacterized protein LOC107477253 n=1 Tax=Arachis duranensis TaxID=130453 RepID=A0A6P4CN61_ARADU|nr:uncharacterized protein LOC107477253 [Arachis duranensis]